MKTYIYDFDYDEVSKGRNLEQNVMLQRGDVIVVP
jgi:polysaccharide export outer membrane protein